MNQNLLNPTAPSLQGAPEGYEQDTTIVDREPVRISTGLSALVAALSVLAMKFFNLELDAETQLAIVTIVAIVGPLVAGMWARARVTPVK